MHATRIDEAQFFYSRLWVNAMESSQYAGIPKCHVSRTQVAILQASSILVQNA